MSKSRLKPKPLIALDADGVLLDYNRCYGQMWAEVFGEMPVLSDDRAYHADRFWGVTNPPKSHAFWSRFDATAWSKMPAMPGAVQACHDLVAAGFELVCVTSMPPHRVAERQQNLRDLGFPIDRVIATGTIPGDPSNPKKKAITELMPVWFVDDELRKLKDLPDEIGRVLLDPGYSDRPNANQDASYLSLQVSNLAEFAAHVTATYSFPVQPSARRSNSHLR